MYSVLMFYKVKRIKTVKSICVSEDIIILKSSSFDNNNKIVIHILYKMYHTQSSYLG